MPPSHETRVFNRGFARRVRERRHESAGALSVGLRDIQRHVPLDVDRVEAAGRTPYQEIGLPDTPPSLVAQPAVENEGHTAPHRSEGGLLGRRASALDDDRLGLGGQQLGDDLGLEGVALIEQPLLERVRFGRGAGHEDVVLGPHRALLGHVAALQRHRAHVVARGHGRRSGGVSPAFRSVRSCARNSSSPRTALM